MALLTVVPRTGPQEAATEQLVRHLRSDVLPDDVRVTGSAAAFLDLNQRLQDRLPVVGGVVVLTSAALLVLVFRSLVAPVKAAFMNLLSVGAAFGAVVALFHWGWGTPALGLDGHVPVNAFVPVFLLGRVREEWDRSHDPVGSVVAGLGATGRVITSAALIDHGHRLRRLRPGRRRGHQDDGRRHGGRDRRGRDARPPGPGPRDDGPARTLELVAARLARPRPPRPAGARALGGAPGGRAAAGPRTGGRAGPHRKTASSGPTSPVAL